MRRIASALLLIVLGLGAAPVSAGDGGRLFQYSTLGALLGGLYDGELTFGELAGQGDFGLGTLNRLDGEMVALDGTFYRVGTDGRPHRLADDARTPFAVVTRFRADRTAPLPAGLSLAALTAHIDGLIANRNVPQAIRIDGTFPTLKLRSVPAQTPPYRKLAEVIEDQVVFSLSDADGTLVGFRMPAYFAGLNVPGFHFHFLSRDRSRGGHVLGLEAGSGTIALAPLADVSLRLPDAVPGFAALDLAGDTAADTDKVERHGD